MAEEKMQKLGPGPTIFEAELGLLKSLGKERIAHNKDNPYANVGDDDLTRADLTQFRNDLGLKLKRKEALEEVEAVRALDHQDLPPEKSSTDFVRLKNAYSRRKHKHDKALKAYKKNVVTTSDELELHVIQESRALKELLEQIKNEQDEVFAKLNDDEFMTSQDHGYVLEAWTKLSELNSKRLHSIVEFDGSLAKIEDKRSTIIGGALRTLLSSLMKVAYIGVGDIQRLTEKEAHEVNLVILGNYRAHADVTAKLKKEELHTRVKTRHLWLDRQIAWRHLRHNDALKRYQGVLNSARFTNPVKRQDILKALKNDQLSRHVNTRLRLLKDLAVMKPPTIKSIEVVELKKKFAELSNTEDATNQEYYDKLLQQKEDMVEEAITVREALRAELHTYGALAEEGDTKSLLSHLDTACFGTDTLEDFFRSAGALKPEIKAIIGLLGNPRLIYDPEVNSLQSRAQFILSASTIANLLEEQGKDGDRKGIQATLEKLRTARRADLAPIMPIFLKQLQNFQTIAGLPMDVVNELKDLSARLEAIIPENTGTSKHGSSSRHARTSSKAASRSSHGHGKSAGGFTTSQSAWSQGGFGGNKNALAELRTIQKRAGIVAYSSELPEEIVADLHKVVELAEMQRHANEVIDAVVEEQSVQPFQDRQDEHDVLIRSVGIALQDQSVILNESAKKVCEFYHSIACIAEQHAMKDSRIDDEVADALTDRLDNFDEKDAKLENAFTEATHSVRHAPNTKVCERSMKEALRLLDEVEDNYREFHDESMVIAKTHPKRVSDEESRFTESFCTAFGLLDEREAGTLGKKAEAAKSFLEQGARKGKKGTRKKSAPAADGTDGASQDDDSGGNGDGIEDGDGDDAADGTDEADEADAAAANDADADATDADKAIASDSVAEEELVIEITDEEMANEIIAKWEIVQANGSFKVTGRTEYGVLRNISDIASDLVEIAKGGDDDDEDDDSGDNSKNEDGKGQEADVAAEVASAGADAASAGDIAAAAQDAAGDGAGNDDGDVSAGQDDGSGANAAGSEQKEGSKSDGGDGDEKDGSEADEDGSDNVPVDPDGTPCVEKLALPVETVEEMLGALRHSLVHEAETTAAAREKKMSALFEERKGDLTFELEERLRTHWPRKGRTDVGFQQPRIGELIAHRQRHERQVRAVKLKLRAQDERYTDLLEQTNASIKKYTEHMKALEESLIEQSNLASLQGVLKRAKETTAMYKTTCQDWLAKLRVVMVDEPSYLIETNKKFIDSCQTFEDGGDYDEREIGISRRSLAKVDERVRGIIEARQDQYKAVAQAQEDALSFFTAFKESYEVNIQDLSMREGLGQKYGAPRRNAQERLRSQMSVSEAAEKAIEEELRCLDLLCEESAEGKKVSEAAVDDTEKENLALRIMRCLFRIRSLLFSRVGYLEFFKQDAGYELDMVPISAGDRGEVTLEFDPEAGDLPLDATFSAAVEDMDRRCRAETKELYEKEGKGNELGPDGIPEKLRGYLKQKKKDAQLFRDDSCRRFREQVNLLFEKLHHVGDAVLGDLQQRSQDQTFAARTKLEGEINRSRDAIEQLREDHRRMLRPDLASPNNVNALKELRQKEEERTSKAQEQIKEGRKAMLDLRVADATVFHEKLVCLSQSLLALFDSFIMPVDLGTLPGDEDIVQPRKSLRRLRKALHKKKIMEARGEVEEVVLRFKKRVWAALPAAELSKSLPEEVLGKDFGKSVEGGDDQNEDDGAAGQGAGDDADGAAAAEAEAVTSNYTHPHKAVVAARDRIYSAYKKEYADALKQCSDTFSELLAKEQLWEENWQKMVAFLVEHADQL